MSTEFKAIVEGLLFVSGDEGITLKQIAKVLDLSEKDAQLILNELTYDYEHVHRGMTIIQSNDVYHLTTKAEHSKYYKKLLQNPRSSRMTQATLETLAIIAYKQPITRSEIEEIRGVNSDYAVQTLLARSLIENIGRKETIGRPIMFGTSTDFLTYFGLSSLDDLPPLAEAFDHMMIEKEADLFLSNEIE